MEQIKENDLDFERLVWKLFMCTGEIRYYMFAKALQENKMLEKTEPSLFNEDSEKMSMGR